jgi:hypothetical protein
VDGIRSHANTIVVDSWDADTLVPGTPQLRLDGFVRGAANVQAPNDGVAAVHVINYDYDVDGEHTRIAENVALAVKLPFAAASARVHAPGAQTVELPVSTNGDGASVVTVPQIGVYSIVEFQK